MLSVVEFPDAVRYIVLFCILHTSVVFGIQMVKLFGCISRKLWALLTWCISEGYQFLSSEDEQEDKEEGNEDIEEKPWPELQRQLSDGSGLGGTNPVSVETGCSRPVRHAKYYGLYNQGATCYLNSVLQVLFMTKGFREAVKRNTISNPDKFINGDLRALFKDLEGTTASTNDITKKLGINSVYEQRDAAEYFEKILNMTSPEASKIFHGKLTQKTVCSKCHAETNVDMPFWNLPLVLVHSNNQYYNLVDGIDKYFTASCFSGENQMYCRECKAKCDSTTQRVMKHHPEVLMLLLKRFGFDYRNNKYVKNNRNVVVPRTLQIPENQTYELYAVVDHSGGLRGGHYTATIKSQDDEKWYNFNDTSVNLSNLQQFKVNDFEYRSGSAYLLFYMKKNAVSSDSTHEEEPRAQDKPVHDNKVHHKSSEPGFFMRLWQKPKRKHVDKQVPQLLSEIKDTTFADADMVDKGQHVVEVPPAIQLPKTAEEKPSAELPRQLSDGSGLEGTNPVSVETGCSQLVSHAKYYGLYNQGATCYLNSVLQVLFMTKDFREAVERNTSDTPIDGDLKALFKDLKAKTASTDNIRWRLRIDTVNEPDENEYLEKILDLSSPEASQIFRGQQMHKIKCSKCHKETGPDDAFWHLPLDLVDIQNFRVEDGIEKYFRASDIQDQIDCTVCCGKSDATTECVMKHHPEVLTLLLKRFEFDNYSKRPVKNNRDVFVPRTLQIPENQTYELYAFVDHSGGLGGGHYTATIKSQDDEKWYKFDDDRVTLLDLQPLQLDDFEASVSAYLLFYRKNNVHAANTQDIREVSTRKDLSSATSGMNNKCQDAQLQKSDLNQSTRTQGLRHRGQSDKTKNKAGAEFEEDMGKGRQGSKQQKKFLFGKK